jgi:hypothetical protein
VRRIVWAMVIILIFMAAQIGALLDTICAGLTPLGWSPPPPPGWVGMGVLPAYDPTAMAMLGFGYLGRSGSAVHFLASRGKNSASPLPVA